MNKMAVMPIYGKTRLQNFERFEAESWYTASGTQSLLCSNDDTRMTFDLFTVWSISVGFGFDPRRVGNILSRCVMKYFL